MRGMGGAEDAKRKDDILFDLPIHIHIFCKYKYIDRVDPFFKLKINQ